MTDRAKLTALYDRLAAEQLCLVEAAARVGIVPPAGTLRTIADIELALSAVGVMIDEIPEQG